LKHRTIVIRGDAFRSPEKLQIDAFKTTVEHVIKPLTKIGINVNVIVVTCEHSLNHIIKDIFVDYEYELVIIEKTNSQSDNFISMLNTIENKLARKDFVLITRCDLHFIANIDYTIINKKICFNGIY
jgi:hypothetical protein